MKITTQGKITYYYKYRQYAATSNRQWWPVVKLVIDDTAGTSYPFLLSGKAATLAQGYEAGEQVKVNFTLSHTQKGGDFWPRYILNDIEKLKTSE